MASSTITAVIVLLLEKNEVHLSKISALLAAPPAHTALPGRPLTVLLSSWRRSTQAQHPGSSYQVCGVTVEAHVASS